MCGRYTFQPTEEFYRRFHIANRLDGLVARYNIVPGQMVPVIISLQQVVLMRWGLIPRWAKEEKTSYNKEEKTSYKMINARMETLTQRPVFRSLLAANRCMIPASGYYEWKAEARGGKTPYYIHPTNHEFFAFAGLYDVWTNPKGEDVYTFTIITKDSDGVVARLHNRMPVILDRDLEDAWLDPAITKADEVLDILERSAGVTLEAYPVSRMVNRPSVDSEALIQRLA
ncbi:MAG TPA: SOS response-associated peptidase [Candidatus Tectomicrobia bacterium]|nr:SOS response-associated peptidase [Candidatus Tectomicrobia bacterium]